MDCMERKKETRKIQNKIRWKTIKPQYLKLKVKGLIFWVMKNFDLPKFEIWKPNQKKVRVTEAVIHLFSLILFWDILFSIIPTLTYKDFEKYFFDL